jgi:hypothetical protein
MNRQTALPVAVHLASPVSPVSDARPTVTLFAEA